MPDRPADLRRDYRLHLQLGAAMALLVALAAFTVPTPPPEEMLDLEPRDVDPIDLVAIPNTAEPLPPPPPAPPPPVEVSDIEPETVLAVDPFDIETFKPTPPAGPPARPSPPPPPPVVRRETPPPVDVLPEDSDQPFIVVEVEPVLIGGLEGLQSRVTYPEIARLADVQGTVYVQFIVERDGSVTEAIVLRSPHAALSEAALSAVQESRFTPGIQRGVAVRVRYTVPVRFVLR